MLPITKFPKYLSPSSLMAYEGQPNKFYLQRMAPDPFPYDPQGWPAAVGSAFDAFIKAHIAKELGIEEVVRQRCLVDAWMYDKARLEGKDLLALMLFTNIDQKWYGEAVKAGKDLCRRYLKMGYSALSFTDIELNKLFYLQDVPVKMKGDSTVWDDDFDGAVPHDWKVMGYNSKSGVSPKAGYKFIYAGDSVKGAHKSYEENIPMHVIDEKWATQLATYGWGVGLPVGEPFPAYIDALVVRPTGVRTARYRGIITRDFQLHLVNRFKSAWRDVQSGDFVRRLGSFRGLVELEAENENWWN